MSLFKNLPIEKYREKLEGHTKAELIEIALNHIKREKIRLSGECPAAEILQKVREQENCDITHVSVTVCPLKMLHKHWKIDQECKYCPECGVKL